MSELQLHVLLMSAATGPNFSLEARGDLRARLHIPLILTTNTVMGYKACGAGMTRSSRVWFWVGVLVLLLCVLVEAAVVGGGGFVPSQRPNIPQCRAELAAVEYVVSMAANGANSVIAADIDGDCDLDLASASSLDDKIAWYENIDGNGTFGPQQVVSTAASSARSVIAADIDGDGDLDLASASYDDDKIAWYENTDGAGTFGPQQVVSTAADDARSVIAADIDGDGDLDLASASYSDDKIAWYENTDGAGTFGPQQVVSTAADFAHSVIAADIDGDGDLDLVSASWNDDKIAWYENTDGAGTFGPQQVVSTAADGARSVIAADIDGDGDLDLASASGNDNKIAWYENTDGAGSFGPQQVVSMAANGANSVIAADIDGDGDLDLASASSSDNKMAWYENIDGAGTFGPQQVVSTAADDARSVIAADIDGDGDLDLASASYSDDKIAWYANTDVAESFGPQQVVSTAADDAWSVIAADIDGDGDLDLASASRDDDKIAWYENTDGAGTFGPQQVVSTAADFAHSVIAADIDGDGDLDLASASYSDDKIAWYENTNGAGSFGPQQVVSTAAYWAQSVIAADIDGDGDMDLASASLRDDKIAWYENLYGNGTFGPQQVVSTAADGARSVIAADIDGDGDLDLASASAGSHPVYDGMIAWYENTDGAGSFGPHQVVSTAVRGAYSVIAADIDGDGDLDLASASEHDDKIAWYENLYGNGTFGPQQVASTAVGGAFSVIAADIDGDGDLDLASASGLGFNGKIAWYENTDGAGSFGPQQVVSTAVNGAVSVIAADMDGDGDLDLASASQDDDKIAWYPRFSRGPFHVYAATTHTFEPSCMSFNPLVVCLSSALTSLSRCARDTLLLPQGQYSCFRDKHLNIIGKSIILAPAESGTVTFACNGNALFRLTSTPNSHTELDLVGLRLENLGNSHATPIVGSSGLRVEDGNSILRLRNVTIDGGSDGGAVALMDPESELVLKRARIELSTAGTDGGAVWASADTIVAITDGSSLSANSAGSNGGCLAALAGSQLVAINATFVGNMANGDGGAVWADTNTIVTLDGLGLFANSAGRDGGGLIALSGSHVAVTNSAIDTNSAGRDGGGFSASDNTHLTLTGCSLDRNTADGLGGGLFLSPFTVANVSNSAITANTASSGGGLAVSADPTSTASAVSVVDIPATSPSSLHALLLDDTTIAANTASRVGGGIFVCGAQAAVSGDRSTWSANAALWSPTTRSSADAFECGGGPWLDTSAAQPGLGSPDIQGPPATLAWAVEPTPVVEAGGVVTGAVRVHDALGRSVVYRTTIAQTTYSPSPVLPLFDLPDILLESPNVALPSATLSIVDGALVPATVTFSVSLVTDGSDRGLPVPPLPGSVDVVPCGLGRGGVTEDGVTTCAPCLVGSESLEVSLAPCTVQSSCPTNTLRLAANTTNEPCVCAPGFYTPSGRFNEPCIACPPGGRCTGGTARPVAGPGFFPDESDPTLFLACPNPDACAGEGQCQAGYGGRLCAQCLPNYYRLRGKCFACKAGVNTFVTVLLVLAALVVAAALVSFSLAEAVRYKFAAAMIGLNALQISALYGRLELDWGPVAAVYFDIASFVNLNLELTSPECSLASGADAWVIKLVLTLVLPILAAAAILVVGCGFAAGITIKLRPVASYSLGQLAGACKRAWFQSLVLLYLPLTGAAFSVFGCRRDEAGRWVLDADPVRSCYNSAWWTGLFPIGLAGIVVYAVAIPGCVVWVLRRARDRMEATTFAARYGFLVGRFTSSHWWFEAAIMARKLMVVMCMTFFFTDEGKANGAVFALVGSFAQLIYAQPYGRSFHNALAVTVLAATMSVLYAGTFDDYTLRMVGVVVGVVATMAAIVIGNGIDLWLIARHERQADEEYFQSGVSDFATSAATPVGGGSFGNDVELDKGRLGSDEPVNSHSIEMFSVGGEADDSISLGLHSANAPSMYTID
ncbi:fibronectin type III domain-containing protein [Thecamonas trahens ATCC 50062]|uniref:Fibronectin type III domain-containing protein n=1 Tax=Thecamonas trahens ATCC 50062 TaxID=461836 RepID=A0A0L0DWC9_THETB|nr:fibronectin type III domain-containing protein [Thecamonas trahens ATCC 50062]KNC56487.1 fibronectin type III domain-containing protein [Thecamonas trahens ATCC 50062]|eukprot:XP_013752639.1 fibronectin type III domain-containing protein [Thecamonas trahens ATCC 50062]